MKKIVITLLIILSTIILVTGCTSNNEQNKTNNSSSNVKTERGINLCDKIDSLIISDKDLGIQYKYSSLADITNGTIDQELLGRWCSADGTITYTYMEGGVARAEVTNQGSSEAKYTCLDLNHYKIICEEVPLKTQDEFGNEVESVVLIYTAYKVENDVLYLISVEEEDTYYNSANFSLIMLYRADEAGNNSSVISKNPISISSLNGTWESEKGTIKITNNKLMVGDSEYNISIQNNDKLVIEKDGNSTPYSFNVSAKKIYDEEKKNATEYYELSIEYVGTDEKDLPNLISVLDNWKADYNWEKWLYTGNFEMKK